LRSIDLALFQVPLLAIQASMPIEDMASTTASFGFVRSLGGTIGINIGGAIFSSQVTQRLSAIVGYSPPAGSSITGAVANGSLTQIVPVEVRNEVLYAYTRAVSTIWIVCAPMLFLAFLFSLTFKHCALIFRFSPSVYSGSLVPLS
jgi:hypothetical protein